MPEGGIRSKAELVQMLRSSRDEIVAKLRALPPAAFEQGRYESGWNGRQILAHIASIEWTYPRLIEVARQPASPEAPVEASEVRRTSPEESSGLATRSARGGIDAYNARQVEKRANATVAELIREFEANRAATIKAIEGVDEALLRIPIRSAGGIAGALAGVLYAIAVEHVIGHVSDITGEQWRDAPRSAAMQVHEDGALRLTRVGPLGPFANNAYVIADRESGEALVVDMPVESRRTLEAAQGLRVTALLLTHSHRDHWAEYDLVKAATGAPVLCHPAERILPREKIDRPLADGEEIALGRLSVRAIHTPGHTLGSTCFLAGRYLISGDTLFPGGPGHSDRPADLQQEIASISERLFVLPDETLVLPGHGEGTTIGRCKEEYAAFASRPHPPDLCGDVLWGSS